MITSQLDSAVIPQQSQPMLFKNADGKISKLSLEKHEITVTMITQEIKQITTFLLINLPKYHIYLGSPWLETNNP